MQKYSGSARLLYINIQTIFSSRLYILGETGLAGMRARFFLSCSGIVARFLTGILRGTFVFHSGFWARTGRAGMRTRSLFFICKIGVFVRRKLQNFAKLCKKSQIFAKYLHMSKKSCNFAPDFGREPERTPKS